MDEVRIPSPNDVLTSEISQLEELLSTSWECPPEVLFMSCLRTMDSSYVGTLLGLHNNDDYTNFIALGGFQAIMQLRPQCTFKNGAPIFVFDEEIRRLTFSFLMNSAKLSTLYHIRTLFERRLANLDVISSNHVEVSYVGRMGVESRDQKGNRQLWGSLRAPISERMYAVLGAPDIFKCRQEISKLVYPWEKHFIGYDSSPFLDMEFFKIAQPSVMSDPLHNFFPSDARFGNLEYFNVQQCAGALFAFALKHVVCVSELLRKSKTTKLEDIVAISSVKDNLLESLASACDASTDSAMEMLNLFTLDHDDAQFRFEVSSPVPPIVQTGATQVVKPAFGILTDPLSFALRKLRRCFPGDWDRAIHGQEQVFRDELYGLFSDQRFYCVPGSVTLRRNEKQLTDIDAAVLDTMTGTLGIFQLKWQLPYYGWLSERQSKMVNFSSGTDSWFHRAQEFFTSHPKSKLTSLFRIPRECGPVHAVVGFSLGRYFSEFAECDPLRHNGLTVATWWQFVAASVGVPSEDDILACIAERLSILQSSDPALSPDLSQRLGSLKVTYKNSA